MKPDRTERGISSLGVALSGYMNASDLKTLASLTGSRGLTRKDDLMALVVNISDASPRERRRRPVRLRERRRCLVLAAVLRGTPPRWP
jgi:hypothetical protein